MDKRKRKSLKYRIPTSAGQCGCPIYIKDWQNSYNVIVIYVDGDRAFNSRVLLNTKIKAKINEWMRKIIKKVKLGKK